MAFENVNFTYPNFCVGPQIGTFCSVNQASSTTILEIKNESGGVVANYNFSSSILGELKGLEYTGPVDLTGIVDNLSFFVLEKVSSSLCMIKRYETRTSSSQLALKSKIIKSTSGSYYYDASGLAVEHYKREFLTPNPGGINYLEIDNKDYVTPGTELLLGPSSDTDNLNETEVVTVNSVVGNKVYLDTNIVNQYVDGDNITFHKRIYLVSNRNVGGGTDKGTIFTFEIDTGALLGVSNKGLYRSIEAAKWYSSARAIALVRGSNLLYVQPYASYQVWKSQNMNNVEDDEYSIIPVEDIAFKGTSLYKLMNKVVKRDDNGSKSTFAWTNYNFQQDTIAPYSNVLRLITGEQILVGPSEDTTIKAKLIDQFGVGLSSTDITFTVTGDGGEFDPITGVVTTDSNGEATIDYTTDNVNAQEPAKINIEAYVTGGLPANGSQYVWAFMDLWSSIFTEFEMSLMQWATEIDSLSIVRQVENTLEHETTLFCRTFFGTNGGNWINPSSHQSEVSTYLPTLIVGDFDGPVESFEGGWGGPIIEAGPMPNKITQVLDFSATKGLGQNAGLDSILGVRQNYEAEGGLQISQLKLSLHTYWVSGIAYDELFTTTNLNQFVFVQDAIPQFWSEKNSVDTYIWIRLRPYAADLIPASVVFMVKEVSYAGDTGYVDHSNDVSITTFVDISSNLGIEIYYDPAETFHHNAIVYVHIEVYDTLGNRIWVDYYFSVIADYRYPYLDNLNPGREDALVPVDTDIYFEIKDQGVGVDIDSLEINVNSRYVVPTSIVKISDHHYQVTYSPADNFYYGKSVQVRVMVKDLSDNENWTNDTYRFYTAESDEVWFTYFRPEVCKRGINPNSLITFLALGTGSGVDKDTIAVQIQEKDVTNQLKLLPVIYRIS